MKKVGCLDCGTDMTSRGHRAVRCLPCQSKHGRNLDAQRKSTPEYKAYMVAYHQRNREKYQQRYLDNRERLTALHDAWRKKHPQKEAEYARKRRAENPDYRKRENEWAAQNPEKTRAYRRTWISKPENYQRKLAMNAKRRALKHNVAVNDLTLEDWKTILHQHDYRCVYCGKALPALTKDHVIPLSRGGNHTKSNIVPACMSCNSRKGNRLMGAHP